MGQGRTHAVAFAKAGFDVVLIDMLEPENEIFKETIALVRDAGWRGVGVAGEHLLHA